MSAPGRTNDLKLCQIPYQQPDDVKSFECSAYPRRYNRSLDQRVIGKQFLEELCHLLKLRERETGSEALCVPVRDVR